MNMPIKGTCERKKEVACQRCGKKMVRYLSQIGPLIFCSHACRRGPVEERFWSKVDKSPHPQGCWMWKGAHHPDGYGLFQWPEKKEQRSHRIAWIMKNGDIPDGLWCLHKCPGVRNPGCCNPDHIYLGTQLENMRDAVADGTHFHARGEESANAILTESAVKEIRANYKRGAVNGLARKFKVSRLTIIGVGQRRSWKHIP